MAFNGDKFGNLPPRILEDESRKRVKNIREMSIGVYCPSTLVEFDSIRNNGCFIEYIVNRLIICDLNGNSSKNIISNNDNLQVFVKTLSGKTITLSVKAFDTIEMMKTKIYYKEGIPINEQRVVCAGKELKYGRLCDYNIDNFSVFNLQLNLMGGSEGVIYIQGIVENEERVSLNVDFDTSVGVLKQLIHDTFKGPLPPNIVLKHDNTTLEDNKLLSEYRIVSRMILYYSTLMDIDEYEDDDDESPNDSRNTSSNSRNRRNGRNSRKGRNISNGIGSNGTSRTNLVTVGTNTVGTNTVGTNTVGTNTVGTNTVGTNTVGTNTVGTNTVGTNTVRTNTVRTNTVINIGQGNGFTPKKRIRQDKACVCGGRKKWNAKQCRNCVEEYKKFARGEKEKLLKMEQQAFQIRKYNQVMGPNLQKRMEEAWNDLEVNLPKSQQNAEVIHFLGQLENHFREGLKNFQDKYKEAQRPLQPERRG